MHVTFESVCPSVCPVDRQQQRRAVGLLLSAPRAEISIDSGGRASAGAGRSAANAGSVTLTADGGGSTQTF